MIFLFKNLLMFLTVLYGQQNRMLWRNLGKSLKFYHHDPNLYTYTKKRYTLHLQYLYLV